MGRDGSLCGLRIFCHKYNIFVRKNLNYETLKCIMKANLFESFHALSRLILHYLSFYFQ